MYSKHFRDSSVRGALASVRRDLGPDAIVLGTDLVPAPGWRGWVGLREVQVTAAASPPASADRQPAPERRRSDGADPRESLIARLLASGLDRALAEAVVDAFPDRQYRGRSSAEIARALAAHVAPLVAGPEPLAAVEVFVGPPGVGKTTTIAKIAAQQRVAGGPRPGLVAADAFRAGAVEQLRIYADIIGTPLRVARTPEELERALKGARKPLLVDTAGRSAREAGVRDQLRLLARRPGVRTHLVMAADTSPASARRILDAYAEAAPARLVLTKLDECESIAPLLSVLGTRRLRLSYLTAGQRVPEDLERATPARLASAALEAGAPVAEGLLEHHAYALRES